MILHTSVLQGCLELFECIWPIAISSFADPTVPASLKSELNELKSKFKAWVNDISSLDFSSSAGFISIRGGPQTEKVIVELLAELTQVLSHCLNEGALANPGHVSDNKELKSPFLLEEAEAVSKLREISHIIKCLYRVSVVLINGPQLDPNPDENTNDKNMNDKTTLNRIMTTIEAIQKQFPHCDYTLVRRIAILREGRSDFLELQRKRSRSHPSGNSEVILSSSSISDAEHLSSLLETANITIPNIASNLRTSRNVINAAPLSSIVPVVVGAATFASAVDFSGNLLQKTPTGSFTNRSTENCSLCAAPLSSTTSEQNDLSRDHMLKHLKPYVCTFKECDKGYLLYSNREEWFSHEKRHRHIWTCPGHCSASFNTRQEFMDHLKDGQQFQLSVAQITTLCDMREIPLNENATIQCPFCNMSITGKIAFESHVGAHMEEIALNHFQASEEQTYGITNSPRRQETMVSTADSGYMESHVGSIDKRKMLRDDKGDKFYYRRPLEEELTVVTDVLSLIRSLLEDRQLEGKDYLMVSFFYVSALKGSDKWTPSIVVSSMTNTWTVKNILSSSSLLQSLLEKRNLKLMFTRHVPVLR